MFEIWGMISAYFKDEFDPRVRVNVFDRGYG